MREHNNKLLPLLQAGAPKENASTVNVENERKAAVKLEKERSQGILTACRAAGFDQAYAETLINNENLSLDQARAAIIEKMAAGQTPAPRSATTVVTADEQVKERGAIEYALLHRSAPADYPLNKPNDLQAHWLKISVAFCVRCLKSIACTAWY
jgi:hypothetical protein